MCVEPGPVVLPVGEDAVGFVVADQRVPSITLGRGGGEITALYGISPRKRSLCICKQGGCRASPGAGWTPPEGTT